MSKPEFKLMISGPRIEGTERSFAIGPHAESLKLRSTRTANGDPGSRHVVEIESGWQDVSNIEIVVNVFILAMVVFNVC